jgi:hypothetical protein
VPWEAMRQVVSTYLDQLHYYVMSKKENTCEVILCRTYVSVCVYLTDDTINLSEAKIP